MSASQGVGTTRKIQVRKVLYLHLGKAYAGPVFLQKMVEADCQLYDDATYVAYNIDSEISDHIAGKRSLGFRTYSNKREFILNLWRIPVIGMRIRRFIREHGISAVVSPMMNYYQDLSIIFWKTPELVYVPLIHDANIHSGDESLIQRFTMWLELKNASMVVTLSASVANALNERVKQRIMELWHPPLTSNLRPALLTQDEKNSLPKLVFFGRLLPYKGIETMLKAAEAARVQGFKFELEIFGEGPESRLQSTTLGTQATWRVGYLEQERIPEVISSADWILLPYEEASQSGVVTLCHSLRIPMIVTPVAGLLEQVQETGGALVSSGTSFGEFAEAMSAALRKSAKPTPFRDIAEKDWPNFVTQIRRGINGF